MKKNLTNKEFIKILYVICDDIEKHKDYFQNLIEQLVMVIMELQ